MTARSGGKGGRQEAATLQLRAHDAAVEEAKKELDRHASKIGELSDRCHSLVQERDAA